MATNGEVFKTLKERQEAFAKFCTVQDYCVKCSCGVRFASATSERVAVEQWNQRA